MVQSKINREFINLRADLTNNNINKGNATQSQSKYHAPLCGAGQNNLLPSQTIPSDNNEEALAGATTRASLLHYGTMEQEH